jgi:hypothetical protein
MNQHKSLPTQRPLVLTALVMLTALLLAGCTVGPRYHAPDPPTIKTYTPEPQPTATATAASGLAGNTQHFSNTTDIPALCRTRPDGAGSATE